MKRIILFLLLLSGGCNHPKSKNIIAPNKGKYWDVLRHRDRGYNKPSYCYYFASDGECLYYNYRIENGKVKRNLFEYGDAVYPNTWRLKSDTLEIQGFDYLIKTINEERITLVLAGKSPDTLILGTSIYP